MLVVQSHDQVPLPFADALLDRFKGGDVPGNYVFTDDITLREQYVEESGFTHFFKTCNHDSKDDAMRHSLDWVMQLATEHGLRVTGSE